MAETKTRPRTLYIDWMRGLEVLAMLEIHAFAAWIAPEHRHGPVWVTARAIGSQAATGFLFLAGVSLALGLRRGASTPEFRVRTVKRAIGLLIGAYLFRLQEMLLSRGQLADLLRVDILNAIAVSLGVIALLAAPGRRGALRAAAVALVVVAVTPLLARLPQPGSPLYDYVFDDKQFIFPTFPYAAYALAGFVCGTVWAADTGRVWLATGLAGVGLLIGCLALQAHPERYLAIGADFRADPRFFGAHLGTLLCLATACRAAQPLADPARFGPIRQLGRTSLLAYWIHVNLCYGPLSWEGAFDLRMKATIPRALEYLFVIVLFILLCSWIRTRSFAHVKLNELFWSRIGLGDPRRAEAAGAKAG